MIKPVVAVSGVFEVAVANQLMVAPVLAVPESANGVAPQTLVGVDVAETMLGLLTVTFTELAGEPVSELPPQRMSARYQVVLPTLAMARLGEVVVPTKVVNVTPSVLLYQL